MNYNKMFQADPVLNMVLLRIRLLSKRRIMWLRKLWQEEGETGGQLAITHAAIDAILNDKDSPGAEFSWYGSDKGIQILNKEIEDVEQKIIQDKRSRFARLHQIFELSREESDMFQLCLAIKLDPSLSRIYAYLHDHAARGYATEELASRLFGYGYGSILKTDSLLLRWQLIQKKETAIGEPDMFKIDPFIAQWLSGREGVDEILASISDFIQPKKPLKDWPVKNNVELLQRIFKDGTKRVRLNIVGSPGSGRRTLAAVLSSKFKKKLLTIDSDRAEDWHLVFARSQRQALLDNYGIAWYGEKALKQTWPQSILNVPLQFIICESDQKPVPAKGVIDLTVEMPELSISEQQKLLKSLVPISQSWNISGRNQLIAQRRMSVGDINAMAEMDVHLLQEVSEVLRVSARNKLGSLAKLVDCPFTRDDLVLPKFLRDTLDDLIFEARERKHFWEQENVRRLFPGGRGLIALFSGVPGTGKTMAAQVIAADLGLDLFRIDLSSVVSKYVGETSQNLERILSRAQHMDIVLLFDEADALFGKRTEVRDAHDRFANTDTNYLLQAIENYEGIALLSTNKKENIDTAFIRRLRYVLEFPKPDAEQREQIWTKLTGKLIKPEQKEILNGQIKLLANNVELTGAQIKYALLSAVFIAKKDHKPLEIIHLLRGLERELMKEGRTISIREREKLMEYA